MLHVTLGVVYLGIVALRRYFIPILLVFWLAAWLGTPAYSPFHYGARRSSARRHCLLDHPVAQTQSLRLVRRGSGQSLLALRRPGDHLPLVFMSAT